MDKKFLVVSGSEDCDEEMFEGLTEEWGGKYKVEWDGSNVCRIILGELTLDEFMTAVGVWGDELDKFELEDIGKLAVNDVTEFDRGRGGWYEVKRLR